ncbi:SCO2522 family protein [Sphaerisporangium sp. NBC_01403]|uniref:SCO2522 family protein n=1 Tax=Sphaerisporangium sp. NBC_01403 TaxID=2903599 RepID=UPI00325604B6
MKAVFTEDTARRRVESTPLSHVSVELGHLYMEDFAVGPQRIRDQFRLVAPWFETFRKTAHPKARVSTCFLIDDYFSRFSTPAEVVPMVIEAAEEAGLVIDYLARESGCAHSGTVDVARLVLDRIVDDPAPGTNGSRPPLTKSGWLCNGRRETDGAQSEAMGGEPGWRPPAQNAARRHSIFVDVELWDEPRGTRVWSCPYLAAVWQLMRLGLLRHHGRPVVTPSRLEEGFPADWDALPPFVQLNPSAPPFAAYRTASVLSSRFLPVELAVRTILGQVAADPEVLSQVAGRARGEGLRLEDEVVDRVSYVFL